MCSILTQASDPQVGVTSTRMYTITPQSPLAWPASQAWQLFTMLVVCVCV